MNHKELKNSVYETTVDLKNHSEAIESFTSQMDTVTEGMLELNQKLKVQGENIVNHEKTIAIAEHRIKEKVLMCA